MILMIMTPLNVKQHLKKKHANLKSFKIFLLLIKKITFRASIGSIISFKPSCKLASTKSICC